MLLVLHGAKKNVGDFLIRERGAALLRHLRPDQELVFAPRWEPLDPAAVERADAVVLCGGPGLRSNFYPRTFSLVGDVSRLTKPVLPLALGWSGQPASHPELFRFDATSEQALRTIHEQIGWSSVRDDVSLEVMRRAAVGDVRRTGCTAWYHLPSLGQRVEAPAAVRSVVFTPPHESRALFKECVRVMRLLKARYPDADRACVFHRGLQADGYTSRREVAYVRAMAAVAKLLGFRIVDAGYDLSKIDFYGSVDLHVGYRVHAHLCCLSQRRPSLLISEDGRGIGQARTLGDGYGFRAHDPELLSQLAHGLDVEEATGQPALHRAVEEIERTWPVMRETVEQLPMRST